MSVLETVVVGNGAFESGGRVVFESDEWWLE